jgi:hypothetical protein
MVGDVANGDASNLGKPDGGVLEWSWSVLMVININYKPSK